MYVWVIFAGYGGANVNKLFHNAESIVTDNSLVFDTLYVLTCQQHMFGFDVLYCQAYISWIVLKASAKFRLIRPAMSMSSTEASSYILLQNIVSYCIPVFRRILFMIKFKSSQNKGEVFFYLIGAAGIAQRPSEQYDLRQEYRNQAMR